MLNVKKAFAAACVIVALVALFIVGSDAAFGITSGGLLITGIFLFIGIGGFPPTKQELKKLIGGIIYGVIFGMFFGFFKPVFVAALLIMVAMRLSGMMPLVFNNYGLIFISIYALPGVARPKYAWQDAVVLVVACLILLLLCTIIEKKALAGMYNTQRPALSPEEEAKPYARYYYMELGKPDPAVEKAAKKVISPRKAMPITSISDLCDKDAPYAENGYCVMPDGSGYVAVRQFLPGVTPEMLEWWGVWHAREDLRYKIWYYPGHQQVTILNPDADDVETAMPKHIAGRSSMRYEMQMIEDTGLGSENVRIKFLTPEQMGFDMDRMAKGDIVFISGGNGSSWTQEANSRKISAVVCHVGYRAEGGLILQSHFWMGWNFDEKGEAHLMLPPGAKIPIFGPKSLSNHCVNEFASLANFLPAIYEEYGV